MSMRLCYRQDQVRQAGISMVRSESGVWGGCRGAGLSLASRWPAATRSAPSKRLQRHGPALRPSREVVCLTASSGQSHMMAFTRISGRIPYSIKAKMVSLADYPSDERLVQMVKNSDPGDIHPPEKLKIARLRRDKQCEKEDSRDALEDPYRRISHDRGPWCVGKPAALSRWFDDLLRKKPDRTILIVGYRVILVQALGSKMNELGVEMAFYKDTQGQLPDPRLFFQLGSFGRVDARRECDFVVLAEHTGCWLVASLRHRVAEVRLPRECVVGRLQPWLKKTAAWILNADLGASKCPSTDPRQAVSCKGAPAAGCAEPLWGLWECSGPARAEARLSLQQRADPCLPLRCPARAVAVQLAYCPHVLKHPVVKERVKRVLELKLQSETNGTNRAVRMIYLLGSVPTATLIAHSRVHTHVHTILRVLFIMMAYPGHGSNIPSTRLSPGQHAESPRSLACPREHRAGAPPRSAGPGR
eukprot:gene196-biopygen230